MQGIEQICALISAIGTQTWEVMMEYDRDEMLRRANALEFMLDAVYYRHEDLYDTADKAALAFSLPARRVLLDYGFWTKE